MGGRKPHPALYDYARTLCGHLTEGYLYLWQALSPGRGHPYSLPSLYQYGSFRWPPSSNRTEPTFLYHRGYFHLDDLHRSGYRPFGKCSNLLNERNPRSIMIID